MVSFVKQGYWRILQLFYLEKTARLHLREIIRRSKLHAPSTTKFLKALEKDNLLKSEKDGNQKKYSLKLNYKTFSVFELMDLERFNALPHIRQKAIKYFVQVLKKKPVIILLFGSTAKGTYKETSDIDLLLVTNTKIKTEEAEKHAEALTGIRISVFQITLDAFSKEIKLKKEPVIQSAINSGYPVFNNIYYYEVLYHGS